MEIVLITAGFIAARASADEGVRVVGAVLMGNGLSALMGARKGEK